MAAMAAMAAMAETGATGATGELTAELIAAIGMEAAPPDAFLVTCGSVNGLPQKGFKILIVTM